MSDKTCDVCGTSIYRYTKTGLCQPCGSARRNRSDDMRAKRSAAAKRRWRDPSSRAKIIEGVTAGCNTPEARALRSQLATAANAGARLTRWAKEHPAGMSERAKKAAATRHSWCPEHLRADMLVLSRAGFLLHERKQWVEEQLELERENARRAVLARFGGNGAD